MEIGKRIKILREERDLSQQDLAELSGFKSRQSIEQIESSSTPPTITTLTKIAKGLRMKLVIDLVEEGQKLIDTPDLVEINCIKYKKYFCSFPTTTVDLNEAIVGMPNGEFKNKLKKFCLLLPESKLKKSIKEESFQQAVRLYFTEHYG